MLGSLKNCGQTVSSMCVLIERVLLLFWATEVPLPRTSLLWANQASWSLHCKPTTINSSVQLYAHSFTLATFITDTLAPSRYFCFVFIALRAILNHAHGFFRSLLLVLGDHIWCQGSNYVQSKHLDYLSLCTHSMLDFLFCLGDISRWNFGIRSGSAAFKARVLSCTLFNSYLPC